MAIRQFSVAIDSRLGEILADLDGSTTGAKFKARVLALASSGVSDAPVDHRAALSSQLWMLERFANEDIALTAAGYLKPADVRAVAEVLPTMTDRIFRVSTEIHTQPVLYFRQHLTRVGLLRKYKGTLSATKKGRLGLADPNTLWAHLASTLIPHRPSFDQAASVIVLVHMGTTDGRIDIHAVARTMTALGWRLSTGQEVDQTDVYPIWNDLWAALGNVGDRVETRHRSLDRTLSPAAVAMIRDALFMSDAPAPSGRMER